MKPVSERRRERDKVYPDARDECFRRAEGRCAVMALGCTGRAEACHHIAGRRIPDPHAQSNLLACCHRCHARIHQSPRWARERGYMRSRMTAVRPSALLREDRT